MKQFKLHTGLVLSLLVGLIITSCTQEPPYNVLLIVADDMNEYGFYHTHPQVKTPSLDAFREESVSFLHSYCAAPACSPSRTAFLSGVSPHRSGKYYNGSEVWSTPLMFSQESMMGWDEVRKERWARQLEMELVKEEWGLSPRTDAVRAWDSLSEKDQKDLDYRMAVYAAMVYRVDVPNPGEAWPIAAKRIWEEEKFL